MIGLRRHLRDIHRLLFHNVVPNHDNNCRKYFRNHIIDEQEFNQQIHKK